MKRKVQAEILDHFSPHFNILSGALIGSRSSKFNDYSPCSDFDSFLLVDGNRGHGSEIIVDDISVHVVIIPEEHVKKYLQFSLVRCSWQFLTVMDWIRSGEIFHDPFDILTGYKNQANDWFRHNLTNFVSTKVSEIEINLSKISNQHSPKLLLETNFIALFFALETLLTYSLHKGKVFHGPKRLIRDLTGFDSELCKVLLTSLDLESIDIIAIHDTIEIILNTIKNELGISSYNRI